MFEENPFNRPNPFRGLHSFNSNSNSRITQFDRSYQTYSNSDYRLQTLLKINPFSIPYKSDPIINNGIQDYKADYSAQIMFRKTIEPELPSPSFNYLTKIGGGVISPYQFETRAKQNLANKAKEEKYLIVIEEQKAQTVTNNRQSKDYKKISSISSENSNQIRYPSFKQSQQPEKDKEQQKQPVKINKPQSVPSQKSKIVSKKSIQQQKSPEQGLSLNDFPSAVDLTANKDVISNYNQRINQAIQPLTYNTKNSNQSAPPSYVKKISDPINLNDLQQLNHLIAPYESLNRIPSLQEMEDDPSQIVVQGQHYYRFPLNDLNQL